MLLFVSANIIVGQVGGEDEDLAGELARPQPADQLQATHPRHAMIGDDDIERLRGGGDLDQRFPAVGRARDLRRRSAQNHGKQLGHGLLIFDREDLQGFSRHPFLNKQESGRGPRGKCLLPESLVWARAVLPEIIMKFLRATALPALVASLLWANLLAAAEKNSVTLSWNPNTEPDLAGYRVHYGSTSAPFDQLAQVATNLAVISNLTNGATYTFAVTAYTSSGAESTYSEPLLYTVGSSGVVPPAILANISTRAIARTGDGVMIGGFIIDGVVEKKVAVRALGPSLAAFGLGGVMTDPFLQLVDASGKVVASNDNWNVAGQQIASYGLAPEDAHEAALVVSLAPGAYSAILSDKNGGSGIGLFELYDLDVDLGRVANISTRCRVESGDNVMIGGFILNGFISEKVITRALGPSLAAFGVSDALSDPSLELYDSNGTLVGSNDNWQSTQSSEITATNLAPSDSREAAMVTTLAPGAYSSVVRGVNGATGVALIEVYALN